MHMSQYADVKVYKETLTEEEVIKRSIDADIILADIFVAPFTDEVISQLDSLKYLIINSTGFDNIHTDLLKSRGVTLIPTSSYSTDSVAEMAIGLMIAVNRNFMKGYNRFNTRPFVVDPETPDVPKFIGKNLSNMTLGILGFGEIGSKTAQLAKALGLNVQFYNRSPKESSFNQVGLDEIFETSDIISVHMALNEDTKGIINTNTIKKMKEGVIVVNTARGGHVVSQDLLEALESRKVRGAGLDILDDMTPSNPLLGSPYVLCTPHLGYLTHQSLENIGNIMYNNTMTILSLKKN